jgi:hypothetical protein
MVASSPAAESLRREIEGAFANAKNLGDDKLVYDNSGGHLECNEVAAAFRGKHWKEIPLDVLRYHSSGLFFFTPEAYRFYLPAYLIAAALYHDEADTIPGSVVFSLIPPSDARDVQTYHRRMEGFTSSQRNAIKSFLEFLKAQHPGDDLLGDLDKALTSL